MTILRYIDFGEIISDLISFHGHCVKLFMTNSIKKTSDLIFFIDESFIIQWNYKILELLWNVSFCHLQNNVGHPSPSLKKNVNVTNTQTTTHYLIVDE